MTATEAQAISKLFENPSNASSSKIIVGGAKFSPTEVSDSLIAATGGSRGLYLCKSEQAIVVALHDETMPAEKCKAHALQASGYFRDLGF